MDIGKLIERQQDMVKNVTKALEARGFDMNAMKGSADLLAARAKSIGGRIEALEQQKTEQTARINGEIKQLRTELASLEKRAAAAQAAIGPAATALAKSRSKNAAASKGRRVRSTSAKGPKKNSKTRT